jgi:hypothetical protein
MHPGISVYAGLSLPPEGNNQMEEFARYIARRPLDMDSVYRR